MMGTSQSIKRMLETGRKEKKWQDHVRPPEKANPLGMVKNIKIWPYWPKLKPESVLKFETNRILWDVQIQIEYQFVAIKPRVHLSPKSVKVFSD